MQSLEEVKSFAHKYTDRPIWSQRLQPQFSFVTSYIFKVNKRKEGPSLRRLKRRTAGDRRVTSSCLERLAGSHINMVCSSWNHRSSSVAHPNGYSMSQCDTSFTPDMTWIALLHLYSFKFPLHMLRASFWRAVNCSGKWFHGAFKAVTCFSLLPFWA